MRQKTTIISIGVLVVGVVLYAFTHERWTTPSTELKTVLGYHNSLQLAEKSSFDHFGHYVGIDEIIGRSHGKYGLTSKCQDSYCFDVSGEHNRYTIKIVPDKNNRKSHNLVSLYSDETKVIRVTYGSPVANATSARLSPKEIQRFTPD